MPNIKYPELANAEICHKSLKDSFIFVALQTSQERHVDIIKPIPTLIGIVIIKMTNPKNKGLRCTSEFLAMPNKKIHNRRLIENKKTVLSRNKKLCR
jgi:hypothetical protein